MDYEKFITQFSEKYVIIEKEALEKMEKDLVEKINADLDSKMGIMKKEILEEVQKNNVLSNGELEIESG